MVHLCLSRYVWMAYANWNRYECCVKRIVSSREQRKGKSYHIILIHHVLSPQYSLAWQIYVCVRVTLNMHRMQYAMHCNLVNLHGRLFPINASHTDKHSFRFLSLDFVNIFFLSPDFRCVHEKVSIACFHQTAKDMVRFFCRYCCCFRFSFPFPKVFASICCVHQQIHLKIAGYLPLRFYGSFVLICFLFLRLPCRGSAKTESSSERERNDI